MYFKRIGNADYAAHLNKLVCVKNIFKLGRIDVITACDNHPFKTLAEIYEAFVIHGSKIARMNPSASVGVHLKGLCVFFRMVKIAYHNRRAGNADFALLTVGKLLLSAGLHNAVVGVREWLTYAALLIHMGGGEAACGNAFRCAVTFAHLNTCVVVIEEFVKAFFKLN